MAGQTQQDRLKAFIARRHPKYDAMIAHWRFLKATYEGGREWFIENIFRGPKEGETEYGQRVERAYRFPHTREVVDLVNKYLFKATITRDTETASDKVNQFWKRSTRSGLDIQQMMKVLSTGSSVYGHVACFVDSKVDAGVQTLEDEKRLEAKNALIYAYWFTPEDILDFALDEDDGELLWIKVREYKREDQDPLWEDGQIKERFRLWTRHDWTLYEEIDAGNRGKYVRTITEGTHAIGEVPCVFVRHILGESRYVSPGLIDDVAYLDRAIANYLSNLDVIIQDQTFSQLVMPAQGMMPGDDRYAALMEMGTKRIFTYDGGQTTKGPEYISPDAAQATLILSVISKIINEIYSTVGLAGERTKEDNSVGIDNSSGVAKAYDFEKVNALLNAKGESLEIAENKIARLVMKYAGESEPEKKLVEYPKTFDTATLLDEIATAEALANINGPTELRREQMLKIVEKLFPLITEELKKKLKDDVQKEWLKEDPALALAGAGAPPTKFPGNGQKTVNPNPRQGQVTKDTSAGK